VHDCINFPEPINSHVEKPVNVMLLGNIRSYSPCASWNGARRRFLNGTHLGTPTPAAKNNTGATGRSPQNAGSPDTA
jgi:hypothetical protein